MTDLYLISCVAKKRDRAVPAKDLYVSEWFCKAREYVESRSGIWYILSAKLGLVAPDQVVEPYDQTLNRMPIAERRAWAHRVRNQMDEQLPSGPSEEVRCIVLAGSRYREFLMEYLNGRFVVEIPMEHLAIGKQLQWLTKRR
ncbi:conserved hypothetical protein (plasmid) [Burkholderia ambifaria MC40-6]|uniref:DUF6884 domain-containing protein n=1 Tax=Burkholderia ambifaria (strain MC40-6) TaxID=398577 RepID=B1Z6N4_BURA4|nr:DUF6884 domain-containing protein [Burkholderia ambifaria]ACB69111.1 conserved hypothetical protein [Burkholderia ambifaria MC40-6]